MTPEQEGPPVAEPPIETWTKESLMAYIRSLEKQAKRDEKRKAALEKVAKATRDMSSLYHVTDECDVDEDMRSCVKCEDYNDAERRSHTALHELDALTPAPQEQKDPT